MVGANVKHETMLLMEKRTAIETELEAIISTLAVPNGPGLAGNLIDKDGFPRADIDISAVRSQRQRVSVLRNDHKDITLKIEQNLHVLHSSGPGKGSSLPQKRTAEGGEIRPQRSAASNPTADADVNVENEVELMQEDIVPRVPVAVFDQVSAGSPAEQDGILLGDLLVKFGSVEGGENLLQRLAVEGQRHRGLALDVVVLRRGIPVHLSLTPRPWSGQGILGCHIRPL